MPIIVQLSGMKKGGGEVEVEGKRKPFLSELSLSLFFRLATCFQNLGDFIKKIKNIFLIYGNYHVRDDDKGIMYVVSKTYVQQRTF